MTAEIKHRLGHCQTEHLAIRRVVTQLIPLLLNQGGWAIDKSLIERPTALYIYSGASFSEIFLREEKNNFLNVCCKTILSANNGVNNTEHMLM